MDNNKLGKALGMIEGISMELKKMIHQLRVLDCEKCYMCEKCHGSPDDACLLFGEAADRLLTQQARIAQLEAELKEERRWIPVEERLPDLVPCGAGTAYSEAVNILTSERKVLTAIWDGTEFITDAEFWEAEGEVITHWTPVLLPLPKRPEVDG